MTQSKAAQPGVTERIVGHYNRPDPDIAYCVGGLRRIAVDPGDERARKMLLAFGPRYFSRNQAFVYSCLKYLGIQQYLDIGVNYGECLVAAPLFCAVPTLGFEANPALLPHLARTLAFNSDLTAIRIVPLAMSDRPGRVIDFHVSASWSGKSSVLAGVSGADAQKISVTTTTVDEQLAGQPRLDRLLIKLDVEGHEPGVIAGARATLGRVPNSIILTEFDAAYLRKAGIGAQTWFESLARDFAIHRLSAVGMTPMESFAAFKAASADQPGLHGDLVLTRLTDPDLAALFRRRIAEVPMRQLIATAY